MDGPHHETGTGHRSPDGARPTGPGSGTTGGTGGGGDGGGGAVGLLPDHHRSTTTLRVNGVSHTLTVDNRRVLLDLLREDLGLVGAKKGCDHGQCGACTVLLDGRRVNSCLLPAVALDGRDVTTVEGLPALAAPEDRTDGHGGGEDDDGDGNGPLHPLQRAFLDRDAFQCGYCTPGQLCSAVGMIGEAVAGHPSQVTDPAAPSGEPVPLTRAEIRERLSGNLCRCGAYPHIVEAVEDVLP
jgi:xanthine dehydrogenase YagT iron-sulfur-binding subunit